MKSRHSNKNSNQGRTSEQCRTVARAEDREIHEYQNEQRGESRNRSSHHREQEAKQILPQTENQTGRLNSRTRSKHRTRPGLGAPHAAGAKTDEEMSSRSQAAQICGRRARSRALQPRRKNEQWRMNKGKRRTARTSDD
jgi:hypothetical protein